MSPKHKLKKVSQKVHPRTIRQKLAACGAFVHKHWRGIVMILAVLFALWLSTLLAIGYWFQFKHRNDPFEPGISFSTKYARELGNDWQANYAALLDDIGFRYVRLMSYWNEIEPAPNQWQFGDLDWQMDEAAKRGVRVTLTIGQRQPRWPECHQPDWADALNPAQQDVELLEFLRQVVGRYKDHPALESYQLENEIANRLFAPHCRTFNRDMLWQEYHTVKQLDPQHPVVINVSNQSGIPWRGPIGDEVGFSIYNIAFARFGPFGYYWSFGWVPALWHSARAGLIEIIHDKPTFIHELQMEPWGPAATKDLSLEDQNRSMDPARMRAQIDYGQRTGMERMYLWGGEWWYWRKTKFNDPAAWETAKEIVRTQGQPRQ